MYYEYEYKSMWHFRTLFLEYKNARDIRTPKQGTKMPRKTGLVKGLKAAKSYENKYVYKYVLVFEVLK
jgi:hypothetical protein